MQRNKFQCIISSGAIDVIEVDMYVAEEELRTRQYTFLLAEATNVVNYS
jgi:hypothetical protein